MSAPAPTRRSGRPLSELSIELLRLSAPHADITEWTLRALSLSQMFPDDQLERRVRALIDAGYLHDHGSPRRGWLTPKGQAALDWYRA